MFFEGGGLWSLKPAGPEVAADHRDQKVGRPAWRSRPWMTKDFFECHGCRIRSKTTQ